MIEFHINNPNETFWCQSCSLPHNDCVCSFAESSMITNQNFSKYTASPVSYLEVDDMSWNRPQFRHSYPSSETSSVPPYSSYSLQSTPALSVRQPSILREDTPTSQNGTEDSVPASPTTKRRPRRGAMSREQAHAVSFQPQPDIHRLTKKQKRLEQNRRSQRSFRDRQAKLVEDLRGKIEVLEDENGKLRKELKKYEEESHVK
jgi:hypothetical protein